MTESGMMQREQDKRPFCTAALPCLWRASWWGA